MRKNKQQKLSAAGRAEKRRIGFQNRVIALFAAMVAGFTLLYLRIGLLGQSGGLLEAAQQQRRYTLTVSESRNAIYDCNILPLTDTCTEPVYAVLPLAENQLAVLDAVSAARRDEVETLLANGRPFLLYGAGELEAPGVVRFDVPVRTAVPQLAAHIVGYLDDTGSGVCGIEKSYDEFLRENSSQTQIVYQLDALGHGIAGIEPEIRESSSSSAGVVLTIDAQIQQIVEEIGGRMLQKGAIVVMDPYTGEIRASASFPGYTLDTLAEAVQDAENTPMINRAFLPYSVGSTFKVVTAAAALEQGLSIREPYECVGQIDVSGQIIHCHKRTGHGEMDMTDALMKSCNPYFIQLGLKVGGNSLLQTAVRFGFGEAVPFCTGISAAAGTLPPESEMINPAAVANLSFGQGKLSATPVQICRMMAAACNGGLLVTPRLVLGTTRDGKTLAEDAAVPAQQILPEAISAQLQSMLIQCVMVEPDQKSLPALVTAGGKTATAQTGRFDEEGEEYEHGWFSGFFPAETPEYVVTVLSEDSGFGGEMAAPVFAAIADAVVSLSR